MSDCVSITWGMNNFSCCWQKHEEAIINPTFSIHIPEETKWKFSLFPRGILDGDSRSFFLYRDDDCSDIEIEVGFTLEMLAADGSILSEALEKVEFDNNMVGGFSTYISRNKLEDLNWNVAFQLYKAADKFWGFIEGKKFSLSF
ncbi:hypothetical protein HNY73_018887 [Argiope bruennichi]|uniref:MATH domain-containing protein n=1 Tax=Argiope bruennichi TaxID=94029 RepID=A0A8T0EJE0_ARGBR|nr:hypothetical protein HNY73_018887 [Argiope bruennichi]